MNWSLPGSSGFSRQEFWSGLPFPSPGDLPNPGMEPAFLLSPALADGFFTTSTTWEAPVLEDGKISFFLLASDCRKEVTLTLKALYHLPFTISPPPGKAPVILKRKVTTPWGRSYFVLLHWFPACDYYAIFTTIVSELVIAEWWFCAPMIGTCSHCSQYSRSKVFLENLDIKSSILL